MTRMRSEIIFLDKNPQGVHTSYIDTTGAKYIVYMKFVSSFHGILRTNFITTPVGLLAVLVGALVLTGIVEGSNPSKPDFLQLRTVKKIFVCSTGYRSFSNQ